MGWNGKLSETLIYQIICQAIICRFCRHRLDNLWFSELFRMIVFWSYSAWNIFALNNEYINVSKKD